MSRKDCERSLPPRVALFVERVVGTAQCGERVRAEVRRELLDHFEDALNDCSREEDREREGDALIASFGDEARLAELIRRGKRRCQKGGDITILVGLGLLVFLIGASLFLGGLWDAFVTLPSLGICVGMITALGLLAFGFVPLCRSLWATRVLLVDVAPEDIPPFAARVLRCLVGYAYVAAGFAFLLGIILILVHYWASCEAAAAFGSLMRRSRSPGLLVFCQGAICPVAVNTLALLYSLLIAEAFLRPAAKRAAFLLGLVDGGTVSTTAIPKRRGNA